MLELHPIFGVTPVLDEVSRIDATNFRDPATIKALTALVDRVVEEAEPGEAQDLFRALEELLKKFSQFEIEAPDEYAQAQGLIVRLKFAAFAVIKTEEVEELLEKHLLSAVKDDINLIGLLTERFSAFEDGVAHGAMRKRLMQTLQNNSEPVGSDPLVVGSGLQAKPPTAGDWLKDYDQFFPAFTMRGSLERLRYFNEGTNARRLNPQDRQILLKIMEVYDFIRFPTVALKERRIISASASPASLPPRAIPPQGQGLAGLKELVEIFNNELISTAKRVNEIGQGEFSKTARVLYDNLFPLPGASHDRALVLGALVVLARQGWLLKLLEEQNPVREQFEKYLRQEGRPEEAPAFALAPTSPVSLGKFLRFVLVRRMRMNESEAAAVAVRLGNILKQNGKPEYFDMAYYDQQSGMFRWKL
ncbi:hypothetical protein HYW17_01585 [Candidatus Uhrbacteria bacterium]|nr:hypothetical protein [Candidatus Uhrbacteria bacterium]